METVSIGVTPIAFSISTPTSVRCVFEYGLRPPTSKTVEPELIDLCKRIRILPVVLYDVDIIGCCKQARKRGGL